MPKPTEEELAREALKYERYPEMTDEERKQVLAETEKWLETFSEEEQAEILHKLQHAAGVSDEVAHEFERLQDLTHRAFDGMDTEDPDEDPVIIQELFGVSQEAMEMWARWLDMESYRYHELHEMSTQEAWVTGLLMGVRIGILMEQTRDGG
jgi:hypothetical protein